MLKVKNNTKGKPIGFGGKINILPGETTTLPDSYRNNASLATYKQLGFVSVEVIEEKAEEPEEEEETPVEVPKEETPKAPKRGGKKPTKAEQLRLSRLESLDGLNDTDLAILADQLEIQAKDCFDVADMREKVRAKLEK